MNKKNIIIRLEKKEEDYEVENLIRESFWNIYRPGSIEHYVFHCLRNNSDFVPGLNFVMEKDGEIIGQNIFVKTFIKADNGKNIPIMTMGPICISPKFKRQGYGKILLNYTLEKAKEYGCGAICLEGNIDFFGKCGFNYGSYYNISYNGIPENEDAHFFLCKELIPGYLDGISGKYTTPEIYFINEKEAENFDKKFPPKKKLKLPGQIF